MSSSPFILTLAILCAGCVAEDPNVIVPPDNNGPTDSVFADVVLGYTDGSGTTSCIAGGGVPVCNNKSAMTPPGPCTDDAGRALGPTDNKSFTIPPLGRIEVGFLCNTITEIGLDPVTMGPSNDFVIHGNVGAGALPIVEVSLDGTHYVSENYWPKLNNAYVKDAGFQLEVPMWESARFVRISESSGNGTIDIDAIEALPRLK